MKHIFIFSIFILTFNTLFSQNLNFEWGNLFRSNSLQVSNCTSFDICSDDNNTYEVGAFKDSLYFENPFYTVHSIAQYDSYIIKTDFTGQRQWVKTLQSTNNVKIISLTIDNDDNLLMTGYFSDTTDFDPSINEFKIVGSGLFVLKLDSDGNFIWVKTFEGVSFSGSDIEINNNHILVAGNFKNTINLTSNLSISSINNSFDFYILSLDLNGNFEWIKSIGGDENDKVTSLNIDKEGNINITGYYNSSVDFDTGSSTDIATSDNTNDIFIASYDSLGNYRWKYAFNNSGYNAGTGIVSDNYGNIYVGGYYADGIQFDLDNNTNSTYSEGQWDIFILKLNKNGNYKWAIHYGKMYSDAITDLKIDRVGNVYALGHYRDDIDWDLGSGSQIVPTFYSNSFLLTIDSLGNYKSVVVLSPDDGDQTTTSSNLFIDHYNNVYYSGTIQMDYDLYIDEDIDLRGEIYVNDIFTVSSNPAYIRYFTIKLGQCLINNEIVSDTFYLKAYEDYANYQWLDCSTNTIIQGENNQVFYPDSSGNYAVIVSHNSCTATSDCVSFTKVYANTPDILMSDFRIYPNPTNTTITIESKNNLSEINSIELFDINGKKVLYNGVSFDKAKKQIDISNLSNGVYFVVITTPNQVLNKKIIKQ